MRQLKGMPSQFVYKISKFLLYLVPFSVVIVYQGTLFPFIVGKYVFFRTVVELALIFFVWGWALEGSKFKVQSLKVKGNGSLARDQRLGISGLFKIPIVIAVAVFVLIYVLAGFFGMDPSASFWSNFERGEGSFQLLHFLIFFLLLILLFRDWASWRRLFIISIAAAMLLIAYGSFGALKYVDAVKNEGGEIICGQPLKNYPGIAADADARGNIACGPWFGAFRDFIGSDFCVRFSGSLGNPAYIGTYMIFLLFFSLYLSSRDNRPKKWIWICFSVIFFAFLLLSQTRGAFLGLGAGVFFGLLLLTWKGRNKWFRIGFFLSAAALVALGIFLFKNPLSINLLPMCASKGQVLDISMSAQTFQTRLVLWRQSIEAFKDRPLLGWGPENFSLAIEKHFDPALSAAWFDRAHNIFFDYLVMTGALGFLSFLAIFAVFYWEFLMVLIRSKADAFGLALIFSLPVAYVVQGAVLFDVLPTYVNFFIFMAFAAYYFQELKSRRMENKSK